MEMTGVILDTNAYTAFMGNNPDIVGIIQRVDEIILPSIVIGELLAGFSAGTREHQNREELHEFLSFSRVVKTGITDITAMHYAKAYLSLRKKGAPVPTNDLWIMAVALEFGYGVCSFDKHFRHLDHLIVGTHWTAFLT